VLFDAGKGDSGVVRDALGEIVFSPISGDTETGLVVCYRRVGQNEVELYADGIVRERCVYRAPLTISPLGNFKSSRYQGRWATPIYKEDLGGNEGD
jgi:hypothetical protein